MSSKTLLGLGIAALILIGLFQLTRRERQPGKDQSPVTSAPARPKVLKVPADLDWNQLSEDELRELTSHFVDEGPEKNQRVMGDFDSLVSERETVVTQGHEIAPGKFAFSSLTPRIGLDSDGSRSVKVDIKVFTLEVGGEYTMRYSDELDVRPKTSHEVLIPNGEDLHSVWVRASLSEDTGQIQMRAGEDIYRNAIKKVE